MTIKCVYYLLQYCLIHIKRISQPFKANFERNEICTGCDQASETEVVVGREGNPPKETDQLKI